MNRCVVHPNCIATMLCLNQKCKYQPFLCSACVDENLHKDHQYLSALKFKKEIEALLVKFSPENPMEQQKHFKEIFDNLINQIDLFREFLIINYYVSLETLKQNQNNKQKQLVILHHFVKNNIQEEDIIKSATKVLEFVELVQSDNKQELTFKNDAENKEDAISFNTINGFYVNTESTQEYLKSFLSQLMKTFDGNIELLKINPPNSLEALTQQGIKNIIDNLDHQYLLQTDQIQKEKEKIKEKEGKDHKPSMKAKVTKSLDDEYKPAPHQMPGPPKKRGRPRQEKTIQSEKEILKARKKQNETGRKDEWHRLK